MSYMRFAGLPPLKASETLCVRLVIIRNSASHLAANLCAILHGCRSFSLPTSSTAPAGSTRSASIAHLVCSLATCIHSELRGALKPIFRPSFMCPLLEPSAARFQIRRYISFFVDVSEWILSTSPQVALKFPVLNGATLSYHLCGAIYHGANHWTCWITRETQV